MAIDSLLMVVKMVEPVMLIEEHLMMLMNFMVMDLRENLIKETIDKIVRGIILFMRVWFILDFAVILRFLMINGLLKMESGIALISIRFWDLRPILCWNYHLTCSCSFS